MDRETSLGNLGGVELQVGLEFHKTIDYDRKAMRLRPSATRDVD